MRVHDVEHGSGRSFALSWLTPQEIGALTLREKFKGYDTDQVDVLLDQLAAQIDEMTREREELLARVQRVEADAADSIEAERLLKRTLITAQRTADETVAEAVAQANHAIADAEQQAQRIVSDAELRATEIVADAERRAAELVAQGRREAEARRAAAESDLTQLRQTIGELHRFRVEYRERVRAAVAEQLAQLDRADDIPDVPDDMVRLARLDEPATARGATDQ